MLASCSEDLYDDTINENNSVVARKISMEDIQFKSNSKLVKSVANLKQIQLNKSNSKYEYSEVYDFYIDEGNGVYLEKDNLESYTFPVYKTETDSTITNIIFNKNPTGEYDVILGEYDILKSEFSDITAAELAQSEVEYTNLIGRFRGPELICIETGEYVVVPIEHGDLTGNFGYTTQWVTTSSYCFWTSSSGGGGSDGTGNGTNSGGNTGGGVLTGPIDSPHGGGGGGDLTPPNNPCTTIKKLKKDFVFKTKLASLFQSAKVDNFEKYSVLSADPTPNLQPGQEDAYDYVDAQGLPNAAGATYTAYTDSKGVIHSHYAGLNSIFSPDDLQDLYNKMLVPEIGDDFFIGLVTAEGTAYILQVLDRDAFINFGNQYLADDDKIRKFKNKLYLGKYNLASADKVENEKNFLKMMSDLGMGTSLAGTSFLENSQPNYNLFNNLQVKTINELTQDVQNANCN